MTPTPHDQTEHPIPRDPRTEHDPNPASARHRPARAVRVLALACAAALTAACGPGPAEREAASDLSRQHVLTTARDIAALVGSKHGAEGLNVVHLPEVDDRWIQCTGEPVEDSEVPPDIRWSTSWWFDFTSPRETASLIDEVADEYTAQGWTAGEPDEHDGWKTTRMWKDEYWMDLSGSTSPKVDRVSGFQVITHGPCIPAPDNIREWEPTPNPTPSGVDTP